MAKKTSVGKEDNDINKKSTRKQTASESRNSEKLELLKKRLKGSLMTGDELKPKEWLKLGVEPIDEVLSQGKGYPRGILIEVCGKSQAGKTKICYDALAWAAANLPDMVGFVNVENGFYDERAREQGVPVHDENRFALLDGCGSAEKYAEGIIEMIQSELFSVIVVDSISAMVPRDELDKAYGEASTFGIHARFVKKFTNELNQLCKDHNTTVFLINQFKVAASKMPGKFVDKPTGGFSLEHNTRIRIWVERVGGANGFKLDRKGNRIGGYSQFHIMKGNYGGQDEKGVFEIPFVQADGDPIGEFFYKLKASSKYEPLKDVYKDSKATAKRARAIKYIDPETGVVEVETDDEIAFIRGLLNTPAPDKFRISGKGESAFDYVAKEIKMYDAQKRTLIEALDKPVDAVLPAAEVSDDDVLDGGLDLNDFTDESGEE
jgi:RecA/RadA recombinase